MIKFFRKIRQKLLSENKLSKYLIYAIGEILLVVIGILIALGISDWNETKKHETIIKKNTTMLVESLLVDSLYIVNTRRRIEADIAKINDIKRRATMPTANVDTLIKIARYEYGPRVVRVEFTNETSFNTIVVSGQINLYKKELIQTIYEVYNSQEKLLKTSDHSFQTYLNGFEEYRGRYTFGMSINIIPYGPLYEKVWNNIDEVDFISKFNSMAGGKLIVYNQIKRDLAKVEKGINDLLPKLRNILAEN